ncbi:phosphotransferase [Streptomyces niveiscabiei]|uniref:phosphotransferase n=1 Tax=Streptomyces niveiscabiei TaxID=164115 RepID=UPI0029B16253|nr:phosphotransferase [Streptomyces niveiscabiei]MDX3384812.1 phosphotransferase [Streptomyces niveiscabiei]
MHSPRTHLTTPDLAPLAREAFGPHRRLLRSERLRGGSKKGVYRLHLDDGRTAIAYIWSPDENYWDQTQPPDPRHPFSPATGQDLLVAAHDRLTAAGIRTPRILHVGTDTVVAEDVTGGTLEDALQRDPGHPALDRLAEALRVMHAQENPRYGKVALVDAGGVSNGTSCEQVVYEGALRELAKGVAREPRLAAVREPLAERIGSLYRAVQPRERHALIHGELGADHVLLTEDGEPVLIDIEGLMYFDLEQEHVFLKLRFGNWYERLPHPELDADRLRLYRLCMHLSLVSGPLTLIGGDFPNPGFMRGIAEHNLGEVLRLLDDTR